jgi:hypothetical protein
VRERCKRSLELAAVKSLSAITTSDTVLGPINFDDKTFVRSLVAEIGMSGS